MAWAPETGVDALLVTLRKKERDFSPTTRYRDYPLATVLFVRTTRTSDLGSAPYLCLGEATLAEHRGERPIAITWRLHRDMPPEVLQQGVVASL